VRYVRMLGLCMIAALAFGAMTTASAFAFKKHPSLKHWANCPVKGSAENGLPADLCVYGFTTPKAGGEFTVGTITVPIERSIVLQYGIARDHETEQEFYVPPAHGAEAITPTPEKVPGEPIANISAAEQEELGWSEGLKYSYAHAKKGELKTVYETIEQAGPTATSRHNLIIEEGVAVEAPVKIKGENTWISKLGDVCYVGSSAEPIVQHLTSGESVSPLTGEKIHGEVGEILASYEFENLEVPGNILVDNTYPVPGASCTGPYSSEVAATIDKKFDLPQPAGGSKTIIKGTLDNATTVLVAKATEEGTHGL
jgi:hypothetical protein